MLIFLPHLAQLLSQKACQLQHSLMSYEPKQAQVRPIGSIFNFPTLAHAIDATGGLVLRLRSLRKTNGLVLKACVLSLPILASPFFRPAK